MCDLTRTFVALVIVGFIAGCIISIGLPWLWSALLKPFILWLVL